MPLHRIDIPQASDPGPASTLQHAIAELEDAGEAVVRFEQRGLEWLILTRPATRRADFQTRA